MNRKIRGLTIWSDGHLKVLLNIFHNDVLKSLKGLSREAISFLNAQNDYFGPGGEYIADRIEQDFDLRWDYKRARTVIRKFII